MAARVIDAMAHTIRLCLAAAAAALLTACGGGGSDPQAPPAGPANTVPDSATASVRAYTDYAGQLITAGAGSAESAAPLLLNAADAPVSETDSPLPVQ